MKKGFDFWITEDVSSFLRKYWIIFGAFDLVAMVLAIITNNPFMFLIIGFLPCPIIWIYRAIHNPLYDLEEIIAKYDPEFYKLLLDLSSKLPSIRIGTSKRVHRRGLLYTELMKSHTNKIDERIITFIKNNRSINNSGMISLLIWFSTFMILLFALFFKSQ